MGRKVGPKGQVVIDQAIRQALGVRPGSIALQRLVGDRVEIRFLPPLHTRSLKGLLGRFVQGRPADMDDTEAAWEAWAERHRPS